MSACPTFHPLMRFQAEWFPEAPRFRAGGLARMAGHGAWCCETGRWRGQSGGGASWRRNPVAIRDCVGCDPAGFSQGVKGSDLFLEGLFGDTVNWIEGSRVEGGNQDVAA